MRDLFLGLLLSCAVAIAVRAAEPAKSLALPDLPAVTQKTVQKHVGKGQITAIEQRIDEGETIYEVEFDNHGQKRGLSVGADGTLLSIEVALAETPAPVRKTINEQLKGATLGVIDKVFDDDEVSYEVEIKRGPVERSFTVDSNGKLIHLQVDFAETPKGVQKTITAQGGKVGEIFRVIEKGQLYYDAEVTKDGQKREISVGENGHLDAVRVSLSDLPAPAQKTVKERLGNGHLQRVDKCFDDRENVTFEISAKKDGKRFDFIVGPQGRFKGMNK